MSGWKSNSSGPRAAKVPDKIRRRIHKRDRHTCQACFAPVGPSAPVDHIRPVFEGGTHDPANLRTLCQDCHDQKSQAEAQRARSARSRKRPATRHPAEGLTTEQWEQWRQVMRHKK